MKTSTDRILTTHVGSLPRPDDLIAANRAREAGEATDERSFQRELQGAVTEVVRRQRELGIDVPGDGEFGKSMGTPAVSKGAATIKTMSRTSITSTSGVTLISAEGL